MGRIVIAEKDLINEGNEEAPSYTGVAVKFTNGNVLAVKLSELPAEIVNQLALHGLSQKLGDSYAGETDIDVAIQRAGNVAKRLQEGNWRAVREATGGGRISDLAQALSAVTGVDVAAAAAKIDEMDKAQKTGLRKHAKIAAELARIAAVRAQEKAEKAAGAEGGEEVDLAALLG